MREPDSELDEILKPLMSVQPSTEQLLKWQKRAGARRSWPVRRVVDFAIACSIGFLIGSLVFQQQKVKTVEVANNFDADATIERVYIKSH